MSLEHWSVLGTWVAGLSTLLAVILSLYFSYTNGRIKLIVTAGERLIVSGLQKPIRVVSVRVANCSPRPAKITVISWKLGVFKKTHFLQMFNVPGYDSPPKMLNEGEEGSFIVPYGGIEGNDDWDQTSAELFLADSLWPWLRIVSLRCVVSTSINQQFSARVEKQLKQRLLNNYKTSKAGAKTAS